MSLPNSEDAYVPAEKLTGYLLSDTHTIGRAKARFFFSHGYQATAPEELERGLLEIARLSPLEEEVASPHGTKYVVDGILKTPNGSVISLRTIWIIEPGDTRARFVTAYPV